MKKLIVLSLVFAMLASAAFAVDLSGNIIGTVNVLQSDTRDGSDITGTGTLNRVRIDGSGQANDNFGGYIRAEGGGFTGNAWWKPIDQFKLLIGGNGGDGFIAKEGITGWSFIGPPADTGVTFGGDNVWSGTTYDFWPLRTRYAFYGGGKDGGEDLWMFITPMDILSINICLPFFSEAGKEVADIFKKTVAQIDVKLEGVGNIALTYEGGLLKGNDQPNIFLYYGGSFGAISIDFGFGYHFAHSSSDGGDGQAQPLGIGLGVKYAADAFGVKFRTTVALAGDDKATRFFADVLPYYNLNDKVSVFLEAGLGMYMPDGGDTLVGWHVNPYIRVGEEWGAQFLAGVKLWAGDKDSAVQGNDLKAIYWSVPIALVVSF